MGGCVNIMGSFVSFAIKVQIVAFYTDVCTAPKEHSGAKTLFLAMQETKRPFSGKQMNPLNQTKCQCFEAGKQEDREVLIHTSSD